MEAVNMIKYILFIGILQLNVIEKGWASHNIEQDMPLQDQRDNSPRQTPIPENLVVTEEMARASERLTGGEVKYSAGKNAYFFKIEDTDSQNENSEKKIEIQKDNDEKKNELIEQDIVQTVHYLSYIGYDNKLYISSSKNEFEWAQEETLDNFYPYGLSTFITFKEKLYLFQKGDWSGVRWNWNDKGIYYTFSTDGHKWNALVEPNKDWSSEHPVSLAVFKDKLFMAHVGANNRYTHDILLAWSKDGINWPRLCIPEVTWKTETSITLATFGGNLYIAHVGARGGPYHGKILLARSKDGFKWSNIIQPNQAWYTNSSVSMVAFNGKLYMAHVGKNQQVVLAATSQPSINWPKEIEPNTHWNTKYPINLGVFDNKLYLSYVGNDDSIYISFSSDGETWPEAYQIRNFKTKHPVILQ
jgi:hypothetical protein